MFEEDPLEEEVLHVGATRPAMIWGIPFFIIVPVFVLCLEIEMILGVKMAIILDPPIVLVAVVMVKHDYNGPRLWWIWLTTRALILDDIHWGGTAAAAMPVKASKRHARGVPSDAW
jgi:type IV secretory pathway VirB3-like protein